MSKIYTSNHLKPIILAVSLAINAFSSLPAYAQQNDKTVVSEEKASESNWGITKLSGISVQSPMFRDELTNYWMPNFNGPVSNQEMVNFKSWVKDLFQAKNFTPNVIISTIDSDRGTTLEITVIVPVPAPAIAANQQSQTNPTVVQPPIVAAAPKRSDTSKEEKKSPIDLLPLPEKITGTTAPKNEPDSPSVKKQEWTGKKISLNYQNIEVRAVLQLLSEFTNTNIVTSDSVGGSITLRLNDVPWDQALDVIMQAKKLGQRKSGSVIWIATAEEIASKERQELEAINSLQLLEGIQSKTFTLNYAKAADLVTQINSANANTRMLSSRGGAFADARTNKLFVSDIPSRLEQVNEYVNKIDVPVRQVLIEARIVEASDTFGRSLGAKLGVGNLNTQNNAAPGNSFGTNLNNAVANSGLGGTSDPAATAVNLGAGGQAGYNASTFAFTLFSASKNNFLAVELSALETEGKGKVVSNPRVITTDQVKATIEQGTELPYQLAAGIGATSIAFRKANLKLEVTPQITPDGAVILTLDVTKDSVGQSTTAGFAINTKHIQTQVLVENGGTVVIGGIYEDVQNGTDTKVPLLGDIPVLGNLFKSSSKSTSKQEMLVFITPTVAPVTRLANNTTATNGQTQK